MNEAELKAYTQGHKAGYAMAYESFDLALRNGWKNHLDNYPHGPDHGCDPVSCASMILNEINKIREGRL